MNFINKLLIIGTVAFSLNVNAQELIISDAAMLEISPSAKLVFENGMSLINNSPNGNLNGIFEFRGTLQQKIAGSQPVTLNTLNIENGAFVDLDNDVKVSSELNLNAGIINLSDNNLIMADGAYLNGTFSEMSMIAADGTGELKWEITGNNEYFFPVGDTLGADEYTPATISFNSGTYNNAVVGVNLRNVKHPANTSTVDYLNRYWSVSQSGISDFDCNVEFNYSNNDIVGNESNMYGGKWNGEYWIVLDPLSLTAITGKVQSFSDFTGGELSVLTVEDASEASVEILVNGKNIKMTSDNSFPVKRIELINKLGQRIYSIVPSNALYSEFSINEKSDFYLLRLTSEDKAITKKIYIW